jgi:hypothetical protein
MNAERINIQSGSVKLNLAIIKRSRKIGGDVWGHIWEEGGRIYACSELTDEFMLNGISFLDGKYIKKIKYEFRGKEFYSAALNDRLPVSLSRLRQKFSTESKRQIFRTAKALRVLVAIHPELIDKKFVILDL